MWDKGCVSQILSNLVGNALHHGNATHPVSIEVDGSSTQDIRLRVTNGGEIPAAIQPHLFSPFRSGGSMDGGRAERDPISAPSRRSASATAIVGHTPSPLQSSSDVSTTTGQSGGLGLGLFIVHELVRLHAGTIDARSSADHGTTTFEVTLPRHPASRRVRDAGKSHHGDASAFAVTDVR